MINYDYIKSDIESWLELYFKDKREYNYKIYEAMYYSVNNGGKRIRPILNILIYKLYNNDYKEILPLASAIEMIHTYSLIHDDLPCMDDDDIRRGKPTNHKVFGEAIAILAGDALLNEAMNILFSLCLTKDKSFLEASYFVAQSSGAEGMIGGQVVDILGEGKSISKEELNYMHDKKTGALIRASILSAAIAANAPKEQIHILEEYARGLGLAFQIKDDILDVVGDENLLGKSINKDMKSEKSTFVTTYGLEKCKKMCNDITHKCIENLKSLNLDTKDLEKLTIDLLNREF
ncbi:polyprenyl synthetase family protein [Clostridium sp. MSJ-4]|uniref:Polyprenyl synthetase family protein n=1 Tax=Clostridium simiarum TaxID=2841506 RepID=A0ABS6EWY9_9CLOT|nr:MULTISPECIES: farnesyl diphosphate synthase [Clostridium]MBU5590747.1 polyprenyl synthetase family protein [Clostridium simiarum]